LIVDVDKPTRRDVGDGVIKKGFIDTEDLAGSGIARAGRILMTVSSRRRERKERSLSKSCLHLDRTTGARRACLNPTQRYLAPSCIDLAPLARPAVLPCVLAARHWGRRSRPDRDSGGSP